MSLIDKKIRKISSPIGNLDGKEKTSNGYLLTDWLAGGVFYFKDSIATKVLDLPQGSADLEFDAKSQTIYVPLMNDNKIVIYNLKE